MPPYACADVQIIKYQRGVNITQKGAKCDTYECRALKSRFRVAASRLARTSFDAQSFHLVSKRALRDTEDFRRSSFSRYFPAAGFQRTHDVSSFRFLECARFLGARRVYLNGGCIDLGRRHPERPHSNRFVDLERGPGGEDHGAFDEILQLADVARPSVLHEGSHQRLRDLVDRLAQS